jgi:glycine dehydrogenase subunit 1
MRGRVKGVTTDFVPHTDEDVRAMLAAVGVASVDDLFADIPKALRLGRALDLPAGCSEIEVEAELQAPAFSALASTTTTCRSWSAPSPPARSS